MNPKHTDSRHVRGCSLTCDECGDELELKAHGAGVRGERAREVGAKLVAQLQDLAEVLGWWIRPTSTAEVPPVMVMRHSCPRCAPRVQRAALWTSVGRP